MDTESGRCWRCGKKLRQATQLGCEQCGGLPAYCSRSCQQQDKARHKAVECKMYGPKACAMCGKEGKPKECAECSQAWYCSKECQIQHWPAHKQACKMHKEQANSVVSYCRFRNTAEERRSGDFPYYIGNTPAVDFLQLDNNEWRDGRGKRETEKGRDYRVLSAGCGNLRNTVMTAASLPEGYQGCLHVTLNDKDRFVMARNVLLLHMLAQLQDGNDIGSKVATIWSSLRLPAEHYGLVTASLDQLLAVGDAAGLSEATRGLVTLIAGDLEPLHRVWSCWRAMECRQGQRGFINLQQQRREYFKARPNMEANHEHYLSVQSKAERPHMQKWLDHALFLPTLNPEKASLPYDNPTLTGQAELGGYGLEYSVNDDAMPFTEWDSHRVRRETAGTPSPSPMVMVHTYLTTKLLKVRQLILQGRLRIAIALTEFQQLPKFHDAAALPRYDRIFTSNLADYYGVSTLLHTLKPLLNANNPSSVLVTEFMNWGKHTPQSDFDEDDLIHNPTQLTQLTSAFKGDCPGSFPKGKNNLREYLENTACFMLYLRADVMAGGPCVAQLPKLPNFNHVQNYQGMRMRDFRKKLNRLVPFKYRVNARPLNLTNGMERAVEWCLP